VIERPAEDFPMGPCRRISPRIYACPSKYLTIWSEDMAKERPFGVTILAFLAILGAINAFIYTLQMLHLLPTVVGPVAFYQFSLIGAFLWGFLCLIWLGVFGALWVVHPQGWLFMVIIAVFDLIYGIICVLGGSSWESMASIIIISGLVLIYCLLPGTKEAFGIPR
jgi:hypothetical protein